MQIYTMTEIVKKKKKRYEKSQGSPTIISRSQSQAARGRGNRQNQTRPNRTNVLKALRLALSSPSRVIPMLKGLKNTIKITPGKTKTNRLVE